MNGHAGSLPYRHRARSESRRGPSLTDALGARLRAPALDRELAAGVAGWRSPRHAARALQLTDPRRRTAAADLLEHAAAEAHRAPPIVHRLTAGIPPCRSSVLGCESQIEDLVAVLRGPAPVTAQGMALLRELLCDGGGPLYTSDRAGELQRALHRVARSILVDR